MNINSVASTVSPFALGAATSTATSQANRDDGARYLGSLTASDRELVFQATGVRVDTDPSKPVPLLAVQIGMDRSNGAFSGGQDVSIAYLQNLSGTYSSGPAFNQAMVDQLQKAMDWLRSAGHNGVDVTV